MKCSSDDSGNCCGKCDDFTGLKPITVLITGAGAPGAPSIIKMLKNSGERKIRIIGTDQNRQDSIGLLMLEKVYQIPNDDAFIDTLLNVCKVEKVDVILPLVTSELGKLSKAKESFKKEGFSIAIDQHHSFSLNSKTWVMDKFKEYGLPTPEYYTVNSLPDFIDKTISLGYPKNEVCFKPPRSNGSRGFRILSNSDNRMDNLINNKPESLYMTMQEFIEIANEATYFPELLVMEYLPGQEYSVDCLENVVIPRTRDKLKMGISFIGTVTNNRKIIEYCNKVMKTLELQGIIGFQFKDDRFGNPKIIECNPRVQGSSVLCYGAGYNIVYNAIKQALGEPLQEPNIKWGTRMIRYWDEVFE